MFGVMFNAHAPVTDNFFITGSVGLGFELPGEEGKDPEGNKEELNRMDVGIKAGISFGWFFM